jgi:hypothetical protein
MRRAALLFFVVLGLTVAACSAKLTSSTPLPCDVEAIVAQNCRSCHGTTPQFGAPMSLVTWEDLNAPAKTDATKKVFQLVGTRIHDDVHPMPQPPNARLTAADTAVLDGWIAQGAPKGSSTCGSPDGSVPPDPDAGTTECTPDVDLISPTAWNMPQVDDVYTCFGVEVPVTGDRQVIAIKPHVDNKMIVHHIVLMQAPNPVSPTPTPCQAFGMATWPTLWAWAPGVGDFSLPQEAGFPMSGTMHYVVQIHYNNIGRLQNQTDKSGFGLCTTDKLRPNDADVMAFGTNSINIPAHGTLDQTCTYTVSPALDGRNIFSTFLHMHKLGTQISSTVNPGGTPVSLGSDPKFSFSNQSWTPLSPYAQLHTGDKVATRCMWQNTTDAVVKFGENTEDEMCFAIVAYYPKANMLSWLYPSYTPTCVKN